MAEVAESLATSGDSDSPIGKVDVVECQVPDGSGAGGVPSGQGDDDTPGGVDGQLLDSLDLLVRYREQGEVDWHRRR
ncbi:hypothetical protein [Nonomuraea lactucae]|uniref:hypothetical protein n=1 Tax=Nonomuraea lactucae TaxID=2249762 RepID=UPI0013B3E14D|nr:hypothetical protein [Nonomuraea lactucae]